MAASEWAWHPPGFLAVLDAWASRSHRLILLADTYTPDPAHATYADVSAHDLTAGGVPVALSASRSGFDVTLDGADVSVSVASAAAWAQLVEDANGDGTLAASDPLGLYAELERGGTRDPGTISVQMAGTGITIHPVAPLSLWIGGAPDETATVGEAYSFTPIVRGGVEPYAFDYSAGVLPDGLTLNASTGATTGTPTTEETQAGLVLRVTDAAGSTATLAAFEIAVSAANAPTLSNLVIDDGEDTIDFQSDEPGTAYWRVDDTASYASAAAFNGAGAALASGSYVAENGANSDALDFTGADGSHYFHVYVDGAGGSSNVLSGAITVGAAATMTLHGVYQHNAGNDPSFSTAYSPPAEDIVIGVVGKPLTSIGRNGTNATLIGSSFNRDTDDDMRFYTLPASSGTGPLDVVMADGTGVRSERIMVAAWADPGGTKTLYSEQTSAAAYAQNTTAGDFAYVIAAAGSTTAGDWTCSAGAGATVREHIDNDVQYFQRAVFDVELAGGSPETLSVDYDTGFKKAASVALVITF